MARQIVSSAKGSPHSERMAVRRLSSCVAIVTVAASFLSRKECSRMTDLDGHTDEGLRQELALLLAHARGEVLNDAEVHKFWLLHEEILRRRVASGNAA